MNTKRQQSSTMRVPYRTIKCWGIKLWIDLMSRRYNKAELVAHRQYDAAIMTYEHNQGMASDSELECSIGLLYGKNYTCQLLAYCVTEACRECYDIACKFTCVYEQCTQFDAFKKKEVYFPAYTVLRKKKPPSYFTSSSKNDSEDCRIFCHFQNTCILSSLKASLFHRKYL